MAVHDTEENGRTEYTKKTLESLWDTVDFSRHRLVVIDNGSCEATKRVIELNRSQTSRMSVITLPENVGTARAVNRGIQFREPGSHVVKMDNDVLFHDRDWLDRLEDCVNRDPRIGICGLKRDDLWENPSHDNEWFRSELVMLPHQPGERWLIVEKVHHVMGTCQLLSSALLDKVGYFEQLGALYGLDDSIMAFRSEVAGFWNVFYPHARITHLDPGGTKYQDWKESYAKTKFPAYHKRLAEYQSGARSVYWTFEEVENQKWEGE
jgi:GT2 family glycosyltransferase